MNLKLEIFKSQRKKLFLIILAIISVEGLWLFRLSSNLSGDDLKQGYLGCLYQLPLLNSIILPILISVIVSNICDIEHKGNMFKELITMQSPKDIFNAKLIYAIILMFITIIMQIIILLIIGKICAFQDKPLLSDFIIFFLAQFLPSCFIIIFIEILSLKYVNQFISTISGLILGFLGLMAMFFPPIVMRIVPSSYFGLLSNIQMNWDKATRVCTYHHSSLFIYDWLLIIVFFVLVFLVGRKDFLKKEV